MHIFLLSSVPMKFIFKSLPPPQISSTNTAIAMTTKKSDNKGRFIFNWTTYRINHPEVFCQKMFLNISQNSQESTCFGVSFLIKLQALACNFIKKETLTPLVTCEFCEIFKNSFFLKDLWWLLLHLLQIGAKLSRIVVALVIINCGNGWYKSGKPLLV